MFEQVQEWVVAATQLRAIQVRAIDRAPGQRYSGRGKKILNNSV